MKWTIKLVSMLMALLLFMVSCAAPEAPDQPEQPGNKAPDMVSVTFQNLEAKTTTVSSGTVDSVAIASVYFQYKAVNVEGLKQGEVTEWTNLSERPGLSTVIKLGRGIWHMYLRGFATADARTTAGTTETADTTAIFAGEIETFSAGNGSSALTANADVPLEFTNATGKGSCEIEVTFDEAYANVENKKVDVRIVCGTTDETKTLTFGENGAAASDTAVFTNVDNGIATITVDYLDTDGTPFGDSGTATTLIMTDMTTKTSATISMDVVKLTVVGSKPAGSAEDYFIPKVFNSIFDIYPDGIADNAIVVGYAEETKALNQTPITYPYEVCVSAEKDAKGRYTASSLGLTPIVVTGRYDLATSGATEAWWGKNACMGASDSINTTLTSIQFVDDVTSIRGDAFYKCQGLTSIIIPEGITSIGSYAFYYCKGLNSIKLPKSLTTVESNAFSYCNNISDVEYKGTVDEYYSVGISLYSPKIECSDGQAAFIMNGTTCRGLTSYGKTLSDLVFPENTTNIPVFSFENLTNIKSIIFPENVKIIDKQAFNGCKNLESITFLGPVETIGRSAFANCTSLKSIALPEGSISIYPGAFHGCSSLENVELPSTIVFVEDSETSNEWNKLGVFAGCINLKSINLPSTITKINSNTFNGSGLESITIPESVSTIGYGVFSGCRNLSTVIMEGGSGNSITSIGDRAFLNCSGLTSMTIPNSLVSIGSEAFYGCDNLTDVTYSGTIEQWYDLGYSLGGGCNITCQDGKAALCIKKSIKNEITCIDINNLTPYGKTLTEIKIPNNVTSINTSTIRNCSNIESFVVAEGNTNFSSHDGVLMSYDGTSIIKYPIGKLDTSYEIPDNVTSIGDSAFYNCDNFTSITIPRNVTTIGEEAFRNCSNVTSLSIADSLTFIDWCGFADCYEIRNITYTGTIEQWYNLGCTFEKDAVITCQDGKPEFRIYRSGDQVYYYGPTPYGKTFSYVVIPDWVNHIGGSAFEWWSNLRTLIIPSSVTDIGWYAFVGSGNVEVYIDQPENTKLFYNTGISSDRIHWNSTGPESV